jgi:hypothetical protein
MMNCAECPVIAVCNTKIANVEAGQQRVTRFLSGGAGITAEIRTHMTDELEKEMSANEDLAIESRADTGRALITSYLAEKPILAEKYFEYMDSTNKTVDELRSDIVTLQDTCAGPVERRRFAVIGSVVIACGSTDWKSKLLAKWLST